jgi:1-acyl-sn-glycerol-3-phosphate acyltransferase
MFLQPQPPFYAHQIMLQKRSIPQVLAQTALRAVSWKFTLNLPPTTKYVLIGAPHTSNWDFVYFLLVKYAAGINFSWMGKDSLFRWPVGIVMSRLGGIPVDRSVRNSYVAQIVSLFKQKDQLIILVAPEGTRSRSAYWKTGFYYIAMSAGVPISLGFIDYQAREIGIGPYFMPTGDIQADFNQIKEFYAGKKGKYPQYQGEVRLLAEVAEE